MHELCHSWQGSHLIYALSERWILFGPLNAHRKDGIALSINKEITNMLWTLFVVLLVLWALGLVTAYTAGGLIHVLLVVALVVLVIQVIQGRRVV